MALRDLAHRWDGVGTITPYKTKGGVFTVRVEYLVVAGATLIQRP